MEPVAKMVKRRARTTHERKQEGQFIAQERLNVQRYAKRMLTIHVKWNNEAKDRSSMANSTEKLQEVKAYTMQNMKKM